MAITDYHRAIFDYLETYRREHPEAGLTYSLRQKDKPGRPRNLYLFTGDDKYIGIGLYNPGSGNSKTRTILFYANYDTATDSIKSCILGIVFSDKNLADQEPIYLRIIEQIGPEQFNKYSHNRYELMYKDPDWRVNLQTYLKQHKPIIDRVIQEAGMTELFNITEESLEAAIQVANQPTPVETPADVRYWVFQGKPDQFQNREEFEEGTLRTWRVAAHPKLIKPGDKVILWKTGPQAGCYALAEIASDVQTGPVENGEQDYNSSDVDTEPWVEFKVLLNLWEKPVTKADFQRDPSFTDFNGGKQGTNFKATQEQYNLIQKIATPQSAKYYCVGVTSGDPKEDQLLNYIQEGIWQNGHGEEHKKLLETVRNIPIGSKLAAKSSFTRGPRGESASQLKVRAIGTVISNSGDGKTLKVAWDADFKPFILKGKGYYRSTAQEVTNNEDVQLIFYHSSHQTMEPIHTPSTVYPKNIILYGPPGTGKTYETIGLSIEVVDGQRADDPKVNKSRFDQLRKEDQIEFITFHQSYTYEDFVMGLKPDVDGEDLKFQRSYGIFYRMARRARDNYESSRARVGTVAVKPFQEVFDNFMKPLVEGGAEIEVQMASGVNFALYDLSERSISFRKPNGSTTHTLSVATLRSIYEGIQEVRPNGLKSYYGPLSDELAKLGRQTEQIVRLKNYVLIIDEINRANMSRVFGELITLLEDDKRLGADNELTVTLPSGELFAVPPNLYLIGTMNTADKSLALLDIALRRRFEFRYQRPDPGLLASLAKEILAKLNKAIRDEHKPADFLIGHAYFMGKTQPQLPEVFNNRVIPLLMEYFNGKAATVIKLLGKAGVTATWDEITDEIKVQDVG